MNFLYINLSTLFICVDVTISIKPVKQGMSVKKTLPRTENRVRNVDYKEYPYVVRYEALQSSSSASPSASPSALPSASPSTDVLDSTRSYKSRYICSGAALSPSSTLTAALCCLAAGETKKTIVAYGDSSSEVIKCTKVVSTRDSSHPLIMSDLALLATEPVMVAAYGQLSAIDFGTLTGQQVTILGYGLTADGGAAKKSQQKTLPLQLLDGMWSKCSDDVVYPVMCVTGTCGAEAQCVKDSGGPVVHDSGIVGVSTLAFTDYKCGQASRRSTIDFIYPVGGTVDMIASLVAKIENKNKHKYFQ